jgi:hypothetical protein
MGRSLRLGGGGGGGGAPASRTMSRWPDAPEELAGVPAMPLMRKIRKTMNIP